MINRKNPSYELWQDTRQTLIRKHGNTWDLRYLESRSLIGSNQINIKKMKVYIVFIQDLLIGRNEEFDNEDK